jgi:PPP family 3-phenylpropionic acid transporter
MSAVAGKVFSSNIAFLFTAYFVFRILALGMSILLPPVQGYKNSKNQPGFIDLFKDKKLNIIYGYVFILSCTYGFFTSFNTIYSRDVGISLDIIGIGVMIGSMSQFPFMAAFDWFYKKLGLTNLFLISGISFALRWLLYATILNSGTVLILWALHGFNYVILYLCLTEYVSVRVPPELRTRGQMMNNIILMGISAIIGGYFGGLISTYIGLNMVFLWCSVLSIIAVLLFFSVSRVVSFDSEVTEISVEIAA